MFENVMNRNAKHTMKKTFQNGPKNFLSRTKSRESVGNAKQTIFCFKPKKGDSSVSNLQRMNIRSNPFPDSF